MFSTRLAIDRTCSPMPSLYLKGEGMESINVKLLAIFKTYAELRIVKSLGKFDRAPIGNAPVITKAGVGIIGRFRYVAWVECPYTVAGKASASAPESGRQLEECPYRVAGKASALGAGNIPKSAY
jgi:hypothetical protein